MTTGENLFAEFPAWSREEWETRIAKELKGKTMQDLQWHPGGELAMDVFYQKEDLSLESFSPLSQQRINNDWNIGEVLEVRDSKQCNEVLLEALFHGVNAPCFVWTENTPDFQLPILLREVNAGFISTHFQVKTNHLSLLEQFCKLQKEKGQDSTTLTGSINGDFISNSKAGRDLLIFASQNLPLFKVMTVEANEIHRGPESAVEEVMTLLMRACDNMVQSLHHGISTQEAAGKIQFELRIGSSFFVELAKVRALRMVWPLFLEGFGLSDAPPIAIAAHLAPQTQIADKDLNMIRSTTQAMSAVIGGATRLSILPADAFMGSTSSFSRRMARNIQHILKMESYLDRAIDPAAGSYYIETLTNQIAEKAWLAFQGSETAKANF